MTKPIITLSDAAAERVKALISQSDKPVMGLRLGVKTQGCSGLSYVLEYAEDQETDEEVVEVGGVRVFIDAGATMYLIGLELDYVEDELQSGFVFRNPNEAGRCGCGESFSV